MVSSDLCPRKLWTKPSDQANSAFGFIASSIKSKSVEVILKTYLALVKLPSWLCCSVLVAISQNGHKLAGISSRKGDDDRMCACNFPYETRLQLFN